ncbi:circadian clock-controlled protein daywake [Drosophila gunungcola]|uniref:circadian clock-controlled protein daywake n=1 Tax=Drosophila gunungcola TaxID=103775 RepID=UPI0022E491F4|nr:circadian clock-controlled protein daywake [Drosophila gunungcola]
MLTKVVKFLSLFVFFLATSVAAKYLAEKPDFLTPCVVGDAGFNKCLTSNFQTFFRQWKDGIPGNNAVGSFDPLYIKRVKFAQDASRAIAINADLKEVYVAGAGQAVVLEASWDPNHYVAKALITVPKLRFNFEYKVKGHVVALNLNGHGNGYFEAENALIYLELAVKPQATAEGSFANVQSVKVNFREIKQFRIKLENLFGGNKDLEDTANTLFNENWRDFYEVLRPAVEQTVSGVLLDRFKKTFAYVPATYLIKDFH